MEFVGEGLTFDDVLLVPGKSEILPKETILTTHLTQKTVLNIPLMSAGMDIPQLKLPFLLLDFVNHN